MDNFFKLVVIALFLILIMGVGVQAIGWLDSRITPTLSVYRFDPPQGVEDKAWTGVVWLNCRREGRFISKPSYLLPDDEQNLILSIHQGGVATMTAQGDSCGDKPLVCGSLKGEELVWKAIGLSQAVSPEGWISPRVLPIRCR